MPASAVTVTAQPASPTSSAFNLTRGATLSLLGEGVPMVVSLFAIRILLHRLHEERFAILMLAWTVMAYFSLVDLGIGRALTQSVARRLAMGEEERASTLIWTGLAAIPLLGIAGMIAWMLLTPSLVTWLKVPRGLVDEARWAFYVLAVSLPMLVTTAGLRGILEARARFGLLAAVKCTTGTLVLAAPLVALAFTDNMAAIVGAAVAVRAFGMLLHGIACYVAVREVLHPPRMDWDAGSELFRFGRWLTADNVVTPVLVYGDRWILPRLTSFAAVTFYATPYDFVLRLLFVPFAIASVLFPVFSAGLMGHGHAPATTLDRGARLLAAILFPMALVLVAVAPEAISVWLGPAMAEGSGRVLQLSAIALFLGGMAVVPSALIQAAGRPDIPFMFHCTEIPIHLAALFLFAARWGINGAAAAYVVRVGVEFVAMSLAARALLRTNAGVGLVVGRLMGGTFGGAALLFLVIAVGPLVHRLLLLGLILPAFGFVAWTKLVHREEAAWLWSRLKRAPASAVSEESGVA